MKSEFPQEILQYDGLKYSGILKKTGSSETSVITFKTARRYNPEDRDQRYSRKFMCFSFKVRPHRTRSAAADCGLCPLRNVTF